MNANSIRRGNGLDFTLGAGEIHVRTVWLEADAAALRACREVLSRHETQRADRFAFEHLAQAYETSHGALRRMLAAYLKCRPGDLQFLAGPRGKPHLVDHAPICFNMAHSGDLALYAFASQCEVGIDVEEGRAVPELESIASRYFCSAEASELTSIKSAAARYEAFIRCWTRKEAYIKALGEGLYLPLDQFQVTLLQSDPAKFVHIGNDRTEAHAWYLHHLDPAPNYVGALAYRDTPRVVCVCPPVGVSELFGDV